MASYDRSNSFIRSGISAVWNSQKEIRRMSEIKAFFNPSCNFTYFSMGCCLVYSLELHQCVEMIMVPPLVPETPALLSLEKNFNSGDVLVFRKQGKISTGRVVAHAAIPGRNYRGWRLKVNGSIVIETNVFYKTYPYDKKKVNYPLSLKKDEVFLLCDYREGGRDSRYLGRFLKKKSKEKSSRF